MPAAGHAADAGDAKGPNATAADLGTAQVAKAATESEDHSSKAFAKMKVFKGDVEGWADCQYKFRVEARKLFKDAKAIWDWADH